MKEYELTVVFHPDLEMNIDPALDKIHKLIEANNGKIIKEETEPKRRMSYQIKGQDFGMYYYFLVSLPPEAPNKVENTLAITDEVLRFLLVKPDARKDKYEALRKEREEKRAKHVAETAGEGNETNEKEGED